MRAGFATPRVASVVATLEPVYGIVLAALVLREFPGGRTLARGDRCDGAGSHPREEVLEAADEGASAPGLTSDDGEVDEAT